MELRGQEEKPADYYPNNNLHSNVAAPPKIASYEIDSL
jgi:hypothetical protein